jgi:protein-tyrosine phosphatase
MESVLVGAFKVKDGLFIGDEFAAQDLEFVVANKVTRIVNCASRQVPNHWEPIGVNYLSFSWLDTENQIVLDTSDKNFSNIYSFIEKGLETGESILVHSVRGVSRCVCVVTAYLIKKYQWSLYKSLDFIAFRRPDLDINPAFLTQLSSFEARIVRSSKLPRSEQWDAPVDNPEELVLRNTFMNARLGPATDYHIPNNETQVPIKIKWEEDEPDSVALKSTNKTYDGLVILKSCIKGSDKKEIKVPIVNLQTIQEKNTYSKFNYGKGIKNDSDEKNKIRSSSLNRNDNRLVREAINAARGLIETDDSKQKNVLKIMGSGSKITKKNKDETGKANRPTTAPQKRAPSPRVYDKGAKTYNSGKVSSFGSIKKKTKPNF